MFVAFVGKMGSGKTLLMTYFALKDYVERHRRILTNYRLKFPIRKPVQSHAEMLFGCCPPDGYVPEALDLNALVDPTNNHLRNASVLIDEAWVFFDSRASSTRTNRLASDVFLQSRKRGMDVYITAQSFMQMDVRFRMNCDYLIKAEKQGDYIWWDLHNKYTGIVTPHNLYAPPIYDLYDTNQIIDPTQMDAVKKQLFALKRNGQGK